MDRTFVPGDVAIDGGAIVEVGLASSNGSGIAAPGFIDLQVNGFAGVDLMATDHEGYVRVGEALLATGTTAFQPTFVTAPESVLLDALRAMPVGGIGARVLGAHLEGPFLSPRRTGVHDPSHLSAPDVALLRRLLDVAPVSQMTVAPELPGAFELVDELVARGITVSAGHTDATAAEAHLGFDRGITTVTHLFNAMRPSTSRDPSVGFAALARHDVLVQMIVDLHHVAPDTVRVAWNAAGGRLALVTDAAPAAGMGDGEFVLGGRRIEAEDGVVRGPEGQLAGSALTMIEAVRNLHSLGVSLEAALAAASAVPARIAGRPDLGRLVPGAPADVVVLDDRLEIRQVLVDGRERVGGRS
ncbi:N-acetylglucosamine-6-phosphate deacetylase [Solirubrobacter phytolaccae]|uniref:N-acetylglucosamine-6-phosphate deacetylase n=1 Tax=Solirubrobacter phytolaccae TaxID=1404360 RepID=A0A9X3S8Z6_9ACTN|nr:N-acetylglucosamine-6-phosphate deacetylase [Solirubrobacter phytolaccae]MDA0180981.1 N-acetylglucosamine-6-phosphate deacetylase [Solirubrobacter phytolaccae]